MNVYDWENLTVTSLYKNIISDWENLLNNTSLKEIDYHNYLYSTPGIFLVHDNCHLVVSKLKLGSEYETDFVIVKEGYSDGTQFELIEIETPHTQLFDKSGKPTSKFNAALQQIRDWKRFLKNDKTTFKRIFPTINTRIISDSKINFKIIIGRRTSDQEELEKRRQICEEENIEIVSFDRLTEIAKRRILFFNTSYIVSGQMDYIEYERKNLLANPFYECISDSTWRKICRKGQSHFYSTMIDSIIENRTYSKYFEVFKKLSL